MAFNIADYEPVADRLSRFWADEADGRIITTILSRTADEVVFRAEVWIGERLIATGHAHESVSTRGVNATSAVENCETSAVGRALANARWASKGAAARPSREEMAKVQRASMPPPASRERIDGCRARLVDDKARAWAKATFTWPWSDAACDAIEARYPASHPPDEEPF